MRQHTGRTMGAHHQLRRVAADEQGWRTAARGAIDRDYGPQDLAPELARSSGDASVLMQSIAGAAEINQVADYAANSPAMAGVVGWPPRQDSPAGSRGPARWYGLYGLTGQASAVGS